MLYSNAPSVRTILQLLPGGNIPDIYLSSVTQDYLEERHQYFFKEIFKRVEKLEASIAIKNNEHFIDVLTLSHEQALKTHSKFKIKRFSQIVAGYFEGSIGWDESETLIKLVSALSDIQIKILLFASSIPESGNFEGLKIFYICSGDVGYNKKLVNPVLEHEFPSLSCSALKMFCSELIAKHLLFNEGSNRPYIGGLKLLRKTEITDWLLEKIN